MPLKMSACLELMIVCILDIDLRSIFPWLYEIAKDRSDQRKLILLDLMLVYGCMYRSHVWEFRSRGGMSLQR